MARLPSRFRRLDEILADLPVEEPMLLTELDGYLTGIALCPDAIAPAEWLPPIWGGLYGESAPFEDPIDVQLFADMVTARLGEIVRDLASSKPQPIFETDERNGDVLWELWVAGFDMALALREQGWEAFETGEAAAALAAMRALTDIAADQTALTSIEINAISDTAAMRIPGYLRALCAARPRTPDAPAAAVAPKVGRNDPCPCGSGRKHKKCCGAA